jgi:hypothetical protein
MNTQLKVLVSSFAFGASVMLFAPSATAQYFGDDSHEPNVVHVAAPMPTDSAKHPHESENYGSGTVRSMVLSPIETAVNIGCNAGEIISIIWGSTLLFSGFRRFGKKGSEQTLLLGALAIVLGICTPGCINWLVASARDMNLLS